MPNRNKPEVVHVGLLRDVKQAFCMTDSILTWAFSVTMVYSRTRLFLHDEHSTHVRQNRNPDRSNLLPSKHMYFASFIHHVYPMQLVAVSYHDVS
jgi:hypothetical protein